MYQAMETDPSIEFDHFLAQKLGMTVEEMRHRMSQEEHTAWQVYYGRKAQREEIAMAKAQRR
jgi:hypothetical protein